MKQHIHNVPQKTGLYVTSSCFCFQTDELPENAQTYAF